MLMATANTLNFKLPSDCVPNSNCPLNDIGYAVHLPDRSNCHKFFKCTRGMACSKECPHYGNGNQLVFNPKEEVCDWPFNVPNLPNCVYPGQSSAVETTTPTTIKTETAISITKTTSTKTTTPSTTSTETATSCEGKKYSEDKTDCRYYWVYDCESKKKWRDKCAEGLIFNPIIASCDRASNFPCSTTSRPIRK